MIGDAEVEAETVDEASAGDEASTAAAAEPTPASDAERGERQRLALERARREKPNAENTHLPTREQLGRWVWRLMQSDKLSGPHISGAKLLADLMGYTEPEKDEDAADAERDVIAALAARLAEERAARDAGGDAGEPQPG